jgi:hypothetical protein
MHQSPGRYEASMVQTPSGGNKKADHITPMIWDARSAKTIRLHRLLCTLLSSEHDLDENQGHQIEVLDKSFMLPTVYQELVLLSRAFFTRSTWPEPDADNLLAAHR